MTENVSTKPTTQEAIDHFVQRGVARHALRKKGLISPEPEMVITPASTGEMQQNIEMASALSHGALMRAAMQLVREIDPNNN